MVEGDRPAPARARPGLRALSRALHRDLGHLAVGLTVVYALSGMAVNHVADWEPSFSSYEERLELGAPLAGSDEEAAAAVRQRLHISEEPREVYRAAADDLQIVFAKRTLHVDTKTGHVLDEGQRPRLFLRVANWLHLNRGKKAWTYVADLYAAGLLLLSLTGLFMSPGRKGLLGRGGVLLLVGAAIPIAYVTLSGGPAASAGRPKPPQEAPRR